MIATIIPYFLLASISDNTTWPTGPEFKFISSVEINIKGINGTNQKHGFELFNELTCRPKSEISLHCKFQHKNMTAKKLNTETGEIESKEMIHADHHIYEPFYFDIEFDKKGVSKIILDENMSKHEPVVSIAMAMANALNVGTDLSGVQLNDDPKILREMQNIILDKCKGEIIAVLHSDSSEEQVTNENWKLDLAPPLAKLEEKNVLLLKNWNKTDCKSAKKFFWLGMFVIGVGELAGDTDFTTNLMNIDDMITVSPGLYISASGLRMDIISKDKQLELQEMGNLHLTEVQPAVETWPTIEHPKTIDLNEQK